MKDHTHWKMNGYTTIKTPTGQYTFKGTSDKALEGHVEELTKRKKAIERQIQALWDYLNGITHSDPEVMR